MGDIHTDNHGRLIFLAGNGLSWYHGPPEQQAFLEDEFNNDDWARILYLQDRVLADYLKQFDSMCDGNVHVSVN